MADLDLLQASLGITFKELSLLRQSLVHRSYLNENHDLALASNERLEFLGDAVLSFVVAQKLYAEFPDFSEGDLTRLRAALVCTETLAQIASSLKLGDYLYLGFGEEKSGGRQRPKNLSSTLEAVVGAVLVDQGSTAAQGLILRLIGARVEQAVEDKLVSDYKSRLQELVQSRQRLTPVYRTVDETGPDHAKLFTVEVLAGEVILGRGCGLSKQAAEKEAARAALESLSEGDCLK